MDGGDNFRMFSGGNTMERKSESRRETNWGSATLLGQPSPIGTSDRIERHCAVWLFVPIEGLTGGGTLGRVVPPLSLRFASTPLPSST
jgi:hypothetical protein